MPVRTAEQTAQLELYFELVEQLNSEGRGHVIRRLDSSMRNGPLVQPVSYGGDETRPIRSIPSEWKRAAAPLGSIDGDDMALAHRNAHVRDARVEFFEAEHYYTVDGERYSASVSKLWGQYFPHFNSTATIDKYFSSWSTKPRNKYFALISYLSLVRGMSVDAQKRAISELWTANGTCQSDLGTKMHRCIELYLNECETGDEFASWYSRRFDEALPTELEHFRAWLAEWVRARGWTAYRTEWSIFDEDAEIAGQIDSLFQTESGDVIMVDWKRCKDKIGPNETNRFDPYGFGPCKSLPNTNYGHYSVQQNAYAYILKKRYGIQGQYTLVTRLPLSHTTTRFTQTVDPRSQDHVSRPAASETRHLQHGESGRPWPHRRAYL